MKTKDYRGQHGWARFGLAGKIRCEVVGQIISVIPGLGIGNGQFTNLLVNLDLAGCVNPVRIDIRQFIVDNSQPNAGFITEVSQ